MSQQARSEAMSDTKRVTGEANNTDRELWREREDDYYADSIFVTESGGIGMNVNGNCIVGPIKEWHAAIRASPERPQAVAEGIEKEIVDLLREIAPIMRREYDKADGYFSTRQVERIEALLQRMGEDMSEHDALTQKCRHDKAGSSSHGDYWYCEECGVRVEWIEGMGAGFWSPVSPAPAQSAAHGQDKREKQLIEALQNAEYAIR